MDKNNVFTGKTVLIVSTCGIKKEYIWEKIASLGLRVIVVNNSINWAKPYINHWIIADPTNHDVVLEKIDSFLHEHPEISIDGVFNICEDEVIITAKITEHLGCIGIPLDMVYRLKNKYTFREFCQENNISAPRHRLINSQKDIEELCKSFQFPVVIKPAYGKSSSYVIKISNQQELLNTYLFLQKNLSTEVEPSLNNGKELLVEEYIEGDEVDVEILLQDSEIKFISISDNFPTREPFFIEVGESIPSRLPPEKQKELVEIATTILKKTGIRHGCFHFEAKSTKTEPVPIEINLRMGGCDVYLYMKKVWGVDLIEYGLKIAFGIPFETIEKPSKPLSYIVTETFLIDDPGILTQLSYDPELERKEYFERFFFLKKIGDQVRVPPESYDFLGWIVVSGDSFEQAQSNLREAKQFVHYAIEPIS